MNTTDISDLLPGLDAFLKESCKQEETLHKSESDISKNDLCKPVPNCAFSVDEWSKHSIPFIGDNKVSSNNSQNEIKGSYCNQNVVQDEFESEKPSEFKLPGIDETDNSIPAKVDLQKDPVIEKEIPKMKSALEEAIEMLVKCDAIVGLDYITEYKKNISQKGSFPFRCKLCNSSITRPSIIDHIIGSKHRMRYMKTKNESTYEYLVSLKLDKVAKDAKIAESAFHMEMLYGRGRVTVNTEDFQLEINNENKSKELEIEQVEEPVFTLDKIPIGFEALSPQHEEMDSSAFPLESDLNPIKQDTNEDIESETLNIPVSAEINREVTTLSTTDSVLKLPGLGNESTSASDSKTTAQFDKLDDDAHKFSDSVKEYDSSKLQINVTSSQAKRSLSPLPFCSVKILKTEENENAEPCIDMHIDKKDIKDEKISTDERKEFSMDILDELSKSAISSDEEAVVVLKVIDMLIRMLLRYKLPHTSIEKLENMLNSLQVSSPEQNIIEELKSMLNDDRFHNELKEQEVQKIETSLQDSSREINEQNLSNSLSNKSTDINMTSCEPSVSMQNINTLTNFGSTSMSNANISLAASEVGMNITSQTFGSHSTKTTETTNIASDSNVPMETSVINSQTTNTAELKPPPFPDLNASSIATPALNSQTVSTAGSKQPAVSDLNVSSMATSAMASQAANNIGLQPPPFFSWPQNNETNQVSYSNVQGTQNMLWNNAYQYSQAQYAQMSYYQPQNYGNHFSGTQSYQSQFSVMPLKMAQPPAPPLPPPPPSNPPLPPSMPLPANPPSIPFNQPPPPPPPPLP